MANHKSAIDSIKSDKKKRAQNRYQLKTCKTFVKQLMHTTKQPEATTSLKRVVAMLDKLTKKNIIHRNKAARHKSALTKLVNNIRPD